MRKVLSILGQLSDDDVEWIVGHGRRVEAAPGQDLIRAGHRVDRLYILLQGEVQVLAPNGAELARLGEGEILGEMSLIDKSPPSASVRATQATVFLGLDQDQLRAKIAGDPVFAANMYHAIACFLSMRMRATIANLGYGNAPGNLEDEVELDEDILDKVHLAGLRFERMRQLLA